MIEIKSRTICRARGDEKC